MASKIQMRRDILSNWASVNPALSAGEIGLESDTGNIKIGNGTSLWNALPYINNTYKTAILKPIAETDVLTIGDGKIYFVVPVELNGLSLRTVGAHIFTVSSSGLPTFKIYNNTTGHHMLSTDLTIDVNAKDSSTATTPAVINSSYKVVSTGDEIRLDVTNPGTGTRGLEVRLGFLQ